MSELAAPPCVEGAFAGPLLLLQVRDGQRLAQPRELSQLGAAPIAARFAPVPRESSAARCGKPLARQCPASRRLCQTCLLGRAAQSLQLGHGVLCRCCCFACRPPRRHELSDSKAIDRLSVQEPGPRALWGRCSATGRRQGDCPSKHPQGSGPCISRQRARSPAARRAGRSPAQARPAGLRAPNF